MSTANILISDRCSVLANCVLNYLKNYPEVVLVFPFFSFQIQNFLTPKYPNLQSHKSVYLILLVLT